MKDQVRAILETGISWRGLIYGNIVIAGIVALVMVFVSPKRYTAQAVLMPSLDEGTMVLIGGSAMGEGGLATLLTGGMFTTPSDIYLDLLNSRSVRESLIVRQGLMDYYHAPNMDEALLTLENHLSSKVNTSGMIVIEYTDKDPKLATECVNTLIELLDEFNQRIIVTKGTKMRKFLEKRVDEVRDSMAKVDSAVSEFQKKYKTTGLPEEITGILSTYAELKAQMVSKKYLLQSLLDYAKPTHPEVVALRRDIASMESQLKRMEDKGTGGFGAGFGIGFDSLPDVMKEMARLQREQEVQAAIYEVLVEEYEKAKLLEKRDAPTLEVVDPGRIPQKKSWPKRSLFILGTVFAAMIFGLGIALYAEGLEKLLGREDDPLARLVKTVSRDMAFWRRNR